VLHMCSKFLKSIVDLDHRVSGLDSVIQVLVKSIFSDVTSHFTLDTGHTLLPVCLSVCLSVCMYV